MKLLLTAFDPFGGDPVNPALEAVKLVSGTVGAVQVVKLEVPTVSADPLTQWQKPLKQKNRMLFSVSDRPEDVLT